SLMKELIRHEAAAVLRVSAQEALLTNQLRELGLDSLMAVELRNRLASQLGVKIPLSVLFGSAAAIAGALLAALPRGEIQRTLPALEVDAAGRYEPFELTAIQQAYLVGRNELFEFGGVATHGYYEVDVRGLDVQKLERVVNRLIRRHDMMRVVVRGEGK